jgi:hypothetical protein
MTIYLSAFMLLSSCKPSHKQLNTSKSHGSKPFNNLYIEKEMILAVSWMHLSHSEPMKMQYKSNLEGIIHTYNNKLNLDINDNEYWGINIFDFSELIISNNFNSLQNRWILRRPLWNSDYHCSNIDRSPYNLAYLLKSLSDTLFYSNEKKSILRFPLDVNNRYDMPISKFMYQVKSNATNKQMFLDDLYLFKCKVTFQKVDSSFNAILLPDLDITLKDMKNIKGVKIVKRKSDKSIYDFDGGVHFINSDLKDVTIPIKHIWRKKLKNKSIYYEDIDIDHCVPRINSNSDLIEYAMIRSLHKSLKLKNNYIYAINQVEPFSIDSIETWLQNNPNLVNNIKPASARYLKNIKITSK